MVALLEGGGAPKDAENSALSRVSRDTANFILFFIDVSVVRSVGHATSTTCIVSAVPFLICQALSLTTSGDC